ncbi:TetR/AcrR family transcriptional regulator [Micromonospora sp. ATCC 39149]|uniref:TetR/AcrR family transcriptional regulator n=1 Tax=Micromonospora carbonacea TaxID=47853 RepID=A0A7D6CBB1_9ACTN|nr:TetR/AcrR family transcriptional regulator [Micromonospora sp. ATCC 39149]QLJ96885.1 TetR/AcrR family transcriptional regulator [Micromonospora carbonacea]
MNRRFADRDELIAAVFENKIVLYAEVAEAALKDPDPWAGLHRLSRRLARAQLVDRGFADVLTRTFPASLEYEQNRLRAWDAAGKLIVRAKAAAGLRADFVAEDIVMLLLAHAGVVAGSGRVAAIRTRPARSWRVCGPDRPTTSSIPPRSPPTTCAQSLPTAWRRTSRQRIRTGMRKFGPDPVAVARAVCFAVEWPDDVAVGSLVIRPTVQS